MGEYECVDILLRVAGFSDVFLGGMQQSTEAYTTFLKEVRAAVWLFVRHLFAFRGGE